MKRSVRPVRVLAIASGGGHWVQLLRLRPAFQGMDVAYATVRPDYKADLGPGPVRFYVLNDATRWDKLGMLRLAARVLLLLIRERPNVIISTGALPGFFALRIGGLLGARTAWIDSIANVETLSMSGRVIGPRADLWLTQWAHLAREGGPRFEGAVM